MTHVPVLLKEAVDGLNIGPGDSVLDATFGGGGHGREICKIIGKLGRLIAIDADEEAKKRVSEECLGSCQFELVVGNFRDLDEILKQRGINRLDAILFDLGLSSFQLEESGRGFSFQKDEPLQMTFGADRNSLPFTAFEIVNDWDENNIADIIYGYGGEKFSRVIAKKIVENRKIASIKSTFDLVRVIGESVPDFYKRRRIHFATKTFQAIRIAVNDEMGALKEAISKAWSVLDKGGRLAVISFHELEDRIVKRFFKDKKEDGSLLILTKKPITPSFKEISNNIRSRSAKLRVGEKV